MGLQKFSFVAAPLLTPFKAFNHDATNEKYQLRGVGGIGYTYNIAELYCLNMEEVSSFSANSLRFNPGDGLPLKAALRNQGIDGNPTRPRQGARN